MNLAKNIVGYFLLVLLACGYVRAQDPDFKFGHLTVEDGLSSNTVYSILQDSQGFMWFGTSEGLNRYDGHSFKSYRHDPSDSTSISDNFIWFDGLYEDPFGMIWVGTNADGLNRFDPITETFKRFQYDPNDSSSLSSNSNLSIRGDQSGVLWVGTDLGLNRFDRSTETFERFLHDPDDTTSLVNNRIWEIRETGQGDKAELWIATHNGLDRFDRTTERFEHIKLDGLYGNDQILKPITDIYDDRHGTLWLGSFLGLVKLDLRTMAMKFYRHDPEDSNSLNFDLITAIWQDPGTQGKVLWITTRRGLNRFDTTTEIFSHHVYDPAKPDGIKATGVAALYEDRSQRLWIGSHSEGINKLNRSRRNFNQIKYDPDKSHCKFGWDVQAIHEDRDGTLWVGTEYGLTKWNYDTGACTNYTFSPDTWGIIGANLICGIAQDYGGQLWLGTWGGGLVRFDPQTGEYRQFRHEPGEVNSLANDEVGRVFFDTFGTLWLGTTGQVLSRLLPEDQNTGRFTHFTPQPLGKANRNNKMGFAFLEDSYGGFWVGSNISGLYLFDRETEQFASFRHSQNDPNSLSSNSVHGMFEAVSEYDTIMWVGTAKGLNRFDHSSRTFTRFYNKEFGGSDFILSLTGDAGNNLWLRNQMGISKFDTFQEVFINYAESRGSHSEIVNNYGFLRNGKGEIFFGRMNGMTHFNPDSILSNQHIPPILLTAFRVLNEPAVLDSSITVKKSVDLTYEQNFFSFEFAALDYTDSKNNQYAYKLEGLDKNWINSGSLNFANYTGYPTRQLHFSRQGL
jgi:ligand-binding sensor domain-containing protein